MNRPSHLFDRRSHELHTKALRQLVAVGNLMDLMLAEYCPTADQQRIAEIRNLWDAALRRVRETAK